MKLTKIFLAVVALFAFACHPNNGNGGSNGGEVKWENSGSIVGEWELTQFDNSDNAKPRVYIVFNEDNTFELYQQQYTVVWVRYNGTFALNGTTLSGVYADGTPWASNYTIAYSQEPKQIRLTRTEDKNDVAIYSATIVPAEVVDEARDPDAVRSVEIERFL